jgi:DNA (cytosine-5)-methyltransferase 1
LSGVQLSVLCGISLFSGGGIGDLALRANNIDVLVAAELLEDRAEVFRRNYPRTEMICGDIRKTKDFIVKKTKEKLGSERELDILFATPPCQGMSKNGRGKLLNGVRAGVKPRFDERNKLALDAIDIAIKLNPKLIVFENVPEMQFTLLENGNDQPVNLLETIERMLRPRYFGRWEVIEFADYGVPQRRQRLITVFSRLPNLVQLIKRGLSVLPERTHSSAPTMFTKAWVTVDEALKGVPSLDASDSVRSHSTEIPYHNVPVLDQDKYFWVKNTPSGRGAFDNQCINTECLFDGNPSHGSKHDAKGINKSSKETPIRCLRCGELLPRPWVIEDGKHRLMSGFTSAQKNAR